MRCGCVGAFCKAMYQLRDYQRQAVDRAVAYLQQPTKRNGVLILPTGAGKSLVIAAIAYKLDSPVLIFQPSKEILEQNYHKLLSYGVLDAGIYSASFNSKNVRKVTFATIGSVKNNKDYFRRFRYAIIDECHLVNSEEGMYKDFIDTIQCKVIGLTATPYRLYSSRFYGSMLRFITRTRPRIFSDVVYSVQVRDLLNKGYLSPLNYYQLPIINTSKLVVNSNGSDYTDRSVRKHYKEVNFSDELISVVNRLLVAGRSSILVFTRFIEEAEALAKALGGKAAVVTGDTPASERERTLHVFKGGGIKVVTNVGVLTTGFDFPELDTVVLARPTMSLALYYQMVGRAIRPSKGKVGWVVDICGNYKRFGRVDNLEVRQRASGIWAVYSGHKQLTNVWFNK